MATTMTSLPPYFPAKPQSPRHTHAKVEGGVLIDQEYHRCSHLSALHDPGPHRLRRLAHNAHLKTSLRTKQRQRQKRQIQGQRQKGKRGEESVQRSSNLFFRITTWSHHFKRGKMGFLISNFLFQISSYSIFLSFTEVRICFDM